MSSAQKAAEIHVAPLAPADWYEDDHWGDTTPRCCEAIECVRITLAAAGVWTFDEARQIAREVVRGMSAAAPAPEGSAT